MRLKSLEVQGFKTFPDKTKLDFTDGITAVVGPNGSGKSNISDAIRWALGEQSAKALRCSKMEDVVFNGTQQRKKTGYAQVTLTIDNRDRTLRFDGDEIAVTRRYYRSGNSDYLINNASVRLQDIHELFMDTGLGRDGYSMIGQGKIDSVVSSKGEDRREIFEEAAGISRFRYKKAEAERRLDKTEENLVRLRDIMTELEGRVEPLRIQSEKARSYLLYAEEKRGLEIALWLKTLEKSALMIREQDDKISVAGAQYNAAENELEKIQSESEEIFAKQNHSTSRVEEIRREISLFEEQSSEKKSQISVLQNDILHNRQTMDRINSDIDSIQRSGRQINTEIEIKKKSVEENIKKLSEKKSEFDKYTQELSSLKLKETDYAKKLDEINNFLANIRKKLSDAKIEYMTSSSSINELTERMNVVENTIKARDSQIETLKNIISDYNKMRDDCIDKITYLTNRVNEIELVLKDKNQSRDELKNQADRLSLDGEQLFRKAKMLEELERNLEGYTNSVKTVMRESKRGTLKGIHGPVSRVIRVPSEYSTAVEIALGPAMQNIVTTNDADAKRAIEFLKKRDGGRATFLPISTIKGKELAENGIENCKGFIGIASRLCSCDDSYKGILTSLLGRTAVAENIDCAAEIAKKYGYRFRVVTLDGQIVNTGGSLTGGSLSKNIGLLSRATEIEKIRAQAQKISEQADEVRNKFNDAVQQVQKTENELQNSRCELSEVTEDKIKIGAEIKSRSSEMETTKKSLSEFLDEREYVVKKLSELTEIMNKSRKEYDSFYKQIEEYEQKSVMLSGNKDEFISEREKISEKLQKIRLDSLTIEKDISAAKAEIENANLHIVSSDEKIKQYKEESAEILEKNNRILIQIEELKNQVEELSQKNLNSQRMIQELNLERMSLEKYSAELRQKERDKISERENIGGELARLEERRDNLQKEYDEIIRKLWEEYELTKREAEKAAVKIEEIGKAQRRLSELKQKIRSLGSVNVSAIEEYKEVSERYEFLKVQIGDVENSKAELIKLINELTKQMREIFIERFNLINKNFSETFVELFGGGKASLSLSDPENVLTAGIDISVEPPGKIVSHLELLSGGEKALVAIALYFAIMKVSPAPFCVMDEIEAALDDVNVYRFAAYLRKMNDNTQFICITHRRGTMEEADVLYGVTMQDRGISKLLELRASEIEQKLGIKA